MNSKELTSEQFKNLFKDFHDIICFRDNFSNHRLVNMQVIKSDNLAIATWSNMFPSYNLAENYISDTESNFDISINYNIDDKSTFVSILTSDDYFETRIVTTESSNKFLKYFNEICLEEQGMDLNTFIKKSF